MHTRFTWDTGSGTISFFSKGKGNFVLTPLKGEAIIDIGGIADYILQKAEAVDDKEYKDTLENLREIVFQELGGEEIPEDFFSSIYRSTQYSLEDIKNNFRNISDTFKSVKENKGDLYSFELDLDEYDLYILALLLTNP